MGKREKIASAALFLKKREKFCMLLITTFKMHFMSWVDCVRKEREKSNSRKNHLISTYDKQWSELFLVPVFIANSLVTKDNKGNFIRPQ